MKIYLKGGFNLSGPFEFHERVIGRAARRSHARPDDAVRGHRAHAAHAKDADRPARKPKAKQRTLFSPVCLVISAQFRQHIIFKIWYHENRYFKQTESCLVCE